MTRRLDPKSRVRLLSTGALASMALVWFGLAAARTASDSAENTGMADPLALVPGGLR